ncbi:MAG TPA: hypothetical protein VFP93_04940, partial [Gammaproteobacteria bacterium]|nr:hypothetical protein [Gammaproteobacteria bacterium]
MVRDLTSCLIAFVLLCTSTLSLAQMEMPPVPVEAMHPKKEKILDTIETTGVLKSQSSIWITSETPGRITH